jgi:DNA-binding NarL/FixJ family response regulator
MPGPKPPAVPFSEEERQTLHTLIRAHKTPQPLSFRAQVILLLAKGLTAPEVARRLGTTRTTVRCWRRPATLTRRPAPGYPCDL